VAQERQFVPDAGNSGSERAFSDEGDRVGVAEHVAEVRSDVPVVDVDGDGFGTPDAECGLQPFGPVEAEDGDVLPGADSRVDQVPGDEGGAGVQLGVGEAPRARDAGESVGDCCRDGGQQAGQGEVTVSGRTDLRSQNSHFGHISPLLLLCPWAGMTTDLASMTWVTFGRGWLLEKATNAAEPDVRQGNRRPAVKCTTVGRKREAKGVRNVTVLRWKQQGNRRCAVAHGAFLRAGACALSLKPPWRRWPTGRRGQSDQRTRGSGVSTRRTCACDPSPRRPAGASRRTAPPIPPGTPVSSPLQRLC